MGRQKLKALAALDAAEAAGVHVLLLQEVGSEAKWEAVRAAAEEGGRPQWHVVLRARRRGGVIVAVRGGVPPYLRVVAERGDAHALTVTLEAAPGFAVAGTSQLDVTSMYLPPKATMMGQAARSVLAALATPADEHLRVVGGDVNAALGTWRDGDVIKGRLRLAEGENEGDAEEVLLEMNCEHVEVGAVSAPGTAARYVKRATYLMAAAQEGELVPADGLRGAAQPTRVETRAEDGAVLTATHLSHIWVSAGAVDAVISTAALEFPAAAADAIVNSDHTPLQLALTFAGGGPAPSSAAGVHVPAPPPQRPTAAGAEAYAEASRQHLLAAMDAVYTRDLRRHLRHTQLSRRQTAVDALNAAVTNALLNAGEEVEGGGRQRRSSRPRLPRDVLEAADGQLREVGEALREGRGRVNTRALAAALAGTALRDAVQAAATVAAAQRATALAALKSTAAGIASATLDALAKAAGTAPPAAPTALPAVLEREGQSTLHCPTGGSAAQEATMLLGLQRAVLCRGGEVAGEVPWWQPAVQRGGQGHSPALHLELLKDVPPGQPAAACAGIPRPLNAPVTATDVQQATGKLKRGKSHGADGVTAEHVKDAHPVLFHILAFFLSAVLFTGVLPAAWHVSRLLLLPKRPGARHASHFRPLMLPATLKKLLSVVLLTRLTRVCEERGVPGTCQHAYRAGRSTDTALLAIKAKLAALAAAGLRAVVLVLDICRAFDGVPREQVRRALLRLGLTPAQVEAVGVLYQQTHARLEAQTHRGRMAADDAAPVMEGVAQGDPLSGLLFNLVLHSVQEALAERGELQLPGDTAEERHPLTFYADDVIGVCTPEQAVALGEALVAAIRAVGLDVSSSKCVCLRMYGDTTPLTLALPEGDVVLPAKESAKVLGVTLRQDGSRLTHIQGRAQGALGVARRLVLDGLHVGNAPVAMLRSVMRTYLEPVLLYGVEGRLDAAEMKALRDGQLRCAAALLRVPRAGVSVSALARELALKPAVAQAQARTLRLWAREQVRLGAAADTLLEPGLGAALRLRAEGAVKAALAEAQAALTRGATAALTGSEPEAAWDTQLLPHEQPMQPWWQRDAWAAQAVAALRVKAWAGVARRCECGVTRPTRKHIILDCPAYATERAGLHGLLQVAGGAATPVMHAILGTRGEALQGGVRTATAVLRAWLEEHPEGAQHFLASMCKRWWRRARWWF